jgi:pSer/pThr/pTyr-binding forkhead associated (FHA) protein
MIQLRVLSGKTAGDLWIARRFPVRIGRAPTSSLRLEESGIWDSHIHIDFLRKEGFILQTQPNALASVNNQPIERVVLRNGDLIQLGSVKLQFWLSEPRQVGLRFREWLTWTAITIISLAQVALIYWLLR